MIKIKVRFEDCLEPIPSASTTKEISILAVFQTHPALRAPAVHGVSSKNNPLRSAIEVTQSRESEFET